jgi:transposase-like protein
VLLLAIRVASTGPTCDWEITCPKCNTTHTFEVNLTHILESAAPITQDATVDFNGELRIYLRPYDFEQRNLQLLNEIEESQTLRLINSDSDMDENAKATRVSLHVDKMADRTFEVVALSIQMIEIVATREQVTNRAYISEFLKGITKAQADQIINEIRNLNQQGIKSEQRFTCTSCGHDWEQQLDFDPTSFFD